MKKKNGFTLIELLAVIIILGILMIIAIPSVTRYISDSRKAAYVDTAKQVASATKNLVNSGKLEMFDTNTTYYIPNKCIKVENGEKAKSPYGEFIDDRTYVVVTYDGQGYNYYWVSLDDTGTGVKEPISIDKLNEDNIESDLIAGDIHNDYSKEGKFNIKILEDCANFIDKEASNKPVCIRAKKLNTAICERTDSNGCKRGNKFNTNDVITYGSLGTRGTLKTGDAFDCDVNGDGIYDNELERFYYVSDYYDTHTLEFDPSYAVLINNKNYTNRTINQFFEGWGYSNGETNYQGPPTNHLPLKTNWKNVSLKETNRQILSCNEYKCTNVYNYTSGGNLPEKNFSSNSSRFLTLMELSKGCLRENATLSFYNYELESGELDNCLFLFENAGLTSSNTSQITDVMLETPITGRSNGVWIANANGRTLVTQSVSQFQKSAIRPVIEVPISKIDY